MQTAMLLCGARWERGPFPRQNPPGGIGHPGTAGSGSAAHGRGLAGTVSPRSFAPAHPSMPTTFLLPGISAYPPPPPLHFLLAGWIHDVMLKLFGLLFSNQMAAAARAMVCNFGRVHAGIRMPSSVWMRGES